MPDPPPDPPTLHAIRTARLRLRPFVPDDRPELAAVLTDPAVMEFSVAGPKPPAEVDATLREWCREGRRGVPTRLAVCPRLEGDGDEVGSDTGRPVGFCGFARLRVGGGEAWELGYRLDRAAWGRGYATEAARACRDRFAAAFPGEPLVSLIVPANAASARVAEKLGGRVERRVVYRGWDVDVWRVA